MNQHQLTCENMSIHARGQILVHLYSPCIPSIGATKMGTDHSEMVFLLQEQCCSEKLKIERLRP